MQLEDTMNITSSFKELGFHDSTIESVCRENDSIEMSFDMVVVAAAYPQGTGDVIELRNAKLKFIGVSSERALIWHDDKAPIPHPNPEHPVREVMHGNVHEECFHFDGFWNPDDWSEWYIVADSFVLSGLEARRP